MNSNEAKEKVKYRGYFFQRVLKKKVEISCCEKIEYGWYICFCLKEANSRFGKTIYMPTCFVIDEKTNTYYDIYFDKSDKEYVELIKRRRNNKSFVIRKKLMNFVRDTYERLLFLF